MKNHLLFLLLILAGYQATAQLSPLAIGTIPAGKTLVVKYDVTINNPVSATQVSNQGVISGTNFSSTSSNTTNTVVASTDLTATLLMDNLNFPSASVGTPRDFIVSITEVANLMPSGTILFKIAKLSAFTITYPTSSGSSNVSGGIANTNSEWTFSEDATYVTAQTTVAVPAFGGKIVGFSLSRNVGVPVNTVQSINVTILMAAGNEQNFGNNVAITTVVAN